MASRVSSKRTYAEVVAEGSRPSSPVQHRCSYAVAVSHDADRPLRRRAQSSEVHVSRAHSSPPAVTETRRPRLRVPATSEVHFETRARARTVPDRAQSPAVTSTRAAPARPRRFLYSGGRRIELEPTTLAFPQRVTTVLPRPRSRRAASRSASESRPMNSGRSRSVDRDVYGTTLSETLRSSRFSPITPPPGYENFERRDCAGDERRPSDPDLEERREGIFPCRGKVLVSFVSACSSLFVLSRFVLAYLRVAYCCCFVVFAVGRCLRVPFLFVVVTLPPQMRPPKGGPVARRRYARGLHAVPSVVYSTMVLIMRHTLLLWGSRWTSVTTTMITYLVVSLAIRMTLLLLAWLSRPLSCGALRR